MKPAPRRKPMAEINVVPYIDVMLVLLIIFMVTAPMLLQGVKVELPQTSSEPVENQDDLQSIIVSVDVNGAYFVQLGEDYSQPLSEEQVALRIQKVLSERPETPVLVRGDTHAEYGVIVRLMARLQHAGASSVGLITENPRTTDSSNNP